MFEAICWTKFSNLLTAYGVINACMDQSYYDTIRKLEKKKKERLMSITSKFHESHVLIPPP
jgi:hypothetical protein